MVIFSIILSQVCELRLTVTGEFGCFSLTDGVETILLTRIHFWLTKTAHGLVSKMAFYLVFSQFCELRLTVTGEDGCFPLTDAVATTLLTLIHFLLHKTAKTVRNG